MGRANLANGARDGRDHCLILPSRAPDAGKVSCLWRPDLTGPTGHRGNLARHPPLFPPPPVIGLGIGAARRLPSAVRGLLIGDLPTALWWATPEPPPRAGELFMELADLADQVIYDSLGWPEPTRHLVATANWATGDRVRQAVSDVAWRRLKLWRRLLTQAMDPAVAPGILETIREVTVEHGPHAMTQGWLLADWLALRLHWHPVEGWVAVGSEAAWQFHAPHGIVPIAIRRLSEGETEIQSVRIVGTIGGRSATISCTNVGPGRLAVTSDVAPGVVRTLSTLPQSRADLVARQLPDLARDPLFRECLAFARIMAHALLR